MRFFLRVALVPVALAALAILACDREGGGAPGADPMAIYQQLQDQARAEVQAWAERQEAAAAQGAPPPASDPDPRPKWGERLEAFAREHPDSSAAAEALAGVIGLYVSLGDSAGFDRAFAELLELSPDAPQVQQALAHIGPFRMEEAGGAGILQAADLETKGRVYRQAAPRMAADVARVLASSRNVQTRAAAHFALGGIWYQFELDPAKALEQFRTVAEEYPDWTHAESAALRVRELTDLAVGQPAPDFEGTGLNGRAIRLSALRGQVVLIDFWATWCQPCLDELPGLRRAHDRLRRRGFTIVGVNLDSDVDAVRQFLAIHRPGWPMLATGRALEDPIARLYAIQQLPMSYLVDRAGIIRARALFGTRIEEAADALLRE